MWDASLQSLPSSESKEGLLPLRTMAGCTQESYLAQEPLENSVLQRCVYSYVFFKKQRTLSPFVKLLGGEGPVGKAGRGAGCFSKEEASVSPPCPKSHP